jgi:Xaa-Pro aminopeptidase
MFGKETYTDRRNQLKTAVGHGMILFLGNNESSINYRDNWYPFRQDSCFLYFFGIDRAGLCAVIDIDNDTEIIFGDEPSIDELVFFRSAETVDELATAVGVQHTRPANELEKLIKTARDANRLIHYLPPYRYEDEIRLSFLLGIPVPLVEKGASVTLIKSIVSLRSYKSEAEIVQIEEAIMVTAEMQKAAIRATGIGKMEYEIVSAVEAAARSFNCNLSFPVILTVEGQVLHNYYHGNRIKGGELLLCDCGAENSMHYAGDLTRTFPTSGTFSQKQAEINQVVMQAYDSAVSMLKPGVLFRDIHLQACLKLTEGLIQLGLMKGDPSAAVEEGAHAMFFQCGLGHMMGLDVHDMENLGEPHVGYTPELKKSTQFGLKSLRLGRALEAGFVLTIEPGIYFNTRLMDKWRAENKFLSFINYDLLDTYRDFGGLRVEDDYLITENGYRRLGPDLARSVAGIEELLQR